MPSWGGRRCLDYIRDEYLVIGSISLGLVQRGGSNALLNQRSNLSEGVRCGLVLPYSDDEPSCRLENSICLTITLDVASEFGDPIFGVMARCRSMKRTAMPEATIHKDSDAGPGENNVDTYGPSVGVDGIVLAVPEPRLVQHRSKQPLWLSIHSPVGPHKVRHRR